MQRGIKSFVFRGGRLSNRQKSALDNWLNNYLLPEQDNLWDIKIFNNELPIIIEIGFGMGDSLLAMATTNPQFNFIGIEVFPPGIGNLVANLHEQNISNIKIATFDAVKALKNNIQDNSIYGFNIFFPDPWHKKRHHKRRLIQADFVKLLTTKLVTNGFIHCATDWEDYALHIQEVLQNESLLTETKSHGLVRPSTKFERRGQKLGRDIKDYIYFLR